MPHAARWLQGHVRAAQPSHYPLPRHSHTSSRSNGRPPLGSTRPSRPASPHVISGNQWQSVVFGLSPCHRAASLHMSVPQIPHIFPTDSPQDSAWAGPADASQAQKPQHAPRSRPPSRGSDDSLSSTEAARGDLHELLPIRAPTISYELVRSRAISCDLVRSRCSSAAWSAPPSPVVVASDDSPASPPLLGRCSEGARRVLGRCFGRQFSRQTGRWYRSTARGRRDV